MQRFQFEYPYGQENNRLGASRFSDNNIFYDITSREVRYREFADPDNFDFPLPSTSIFRAAAPDGSDRGPFPYQADIVHVSPDGNDKVVGHTRKVFDLHGLSDKCRLLTDSCGLGGGPYAGPEHPVPTARAGRRAATGFCPGRSMGTMRPAPRQPGIPDIVDRDLSSGGRPGDLSSERCERSTHVDGAPVPGVRNVCDAPKLVGLLAPRKVAVVNAGHGKRCFCRQ